MIASDPALSVRDVTKAFGSTVAVSQLSFEVPRATVLALLGPNGAGKTTTIEMCEGFQKPDSGAIQVLGMNPVTNPTEVRRRIGIMLQGGGAYPGIRVGEMLQLVASYSSRPLDPEWLLQLVGLSAHVRTPYRRLSGGQQQRLSLALALVGRPELVFLDEPTAGMDAQSRLLIWDLISHLKSDGVTVVLTTHLMDEAEALADNVVIIDRGSVVASGTPAELMNQGKEVSYVHLTTASALDLSQIGVPGETLRPLTYRFQAPATPSGISELVGQISVQDVLIRKLEVNKASLEEVFLELTGREMRN